MASNRAVVWRTPPIVTEQVGVVPVHAPPHPTNAEAESGEAISSTWLAAGTTIVQSPGHAIPGGSDATDPAPVPVVATSIG